MGLFNAIKAALHKLQPCKHLRVRETMACDAVCRDCGRNLGFIQNWRDANRGKQGVSEIHNDPSDPLSWNSRKPPDGYIVTMKAPEHPSGIRYVMAYHDRETAEFLVRKEKERGTNKGIGMRAFRLIDEPTGELNADPNEPPRRK